MAKHELWELKQMQSLSLNAKIQMTRVRIKAWIDEYGEDGVYVSFSGGKDSTVLLDIVRKDYPNVKAVFIDTGLEYPEIRQFVKTFENVEIIKPAMNFREVLLKYGYPIIGKEVSNVVEECIRLKDSKTKTTRMQRLSGTLKDNNGNPSIYNMPQWKFLLRSPFKISDKCCDVMKKSPAHKYDKINNAKPIIAQMAVESRLRQRRWVQHGCNAWDLKDPQSNPMSFWTENDVLEYIHKYHLPIAEPYGEVIVKGTEDGQISVQDYLNDYRDCQFCTTGCKRTGCCFCGFGINHDQERFSLLAEQEPKICDYVMRGGEFNDNGLWEPSNNGLGFWFVLEWLNVHGGLKIEIPNREHYIRTYGSIETGNFLKGD